MPHSNCPTLIPKLKLLQAIRAQLSSGLTSADSLSDFRELYDLKQDGERLLEIKEELVEYNFTVEDALNPYQEALQDCGVAISDPNFVNDKGEIKEKIEMKINLQEILTQDRKAYEEAGLNEWFNNIPEDIEDLNLTFDQIEILKSRIEQGEIPIVMPGRLAQLKGLMEAIAKLKPIWIKENTKPHVVDTYHWKYIDNLIAIMQNIAEKTAQGRSLTTAEIELIRIESAFMYHITAIDKLIEAVEKIPESSYLFTTKPSKKNEARTRGKTGKGLSEQLEELDKIRTENEGLKLNCLSIGEYLSLQNRFTNRVYELIKGQVIDTEPAELHSLDVYGISDGIPYGTFSHFIDLPVASDGYVPLGYCDSGDSQLRLSGNGGASGSYGGFRVSVRI